MRCPDTLSCICCCQGIYRVNGAKSRVEKLCQAFENGKHLVELSELYPHDISNVLKLYLRQVGGQSNSFSWIFLISNHRCGGQTSMSAGSFVPQKSKTHLSSLFLPFDSKLCSSCV